MDTLNNGLVHIPGGWSRTVQDFIMQLWTLCNLKLVKSWCLEFSLLIFLDLCWPYVIETLESKTVGKGDYCVWNEADAALIWISSLVCSQVGCSGSMLRVYVSQLPDPAVHRSHLGIVSILPN
jgi:hypothetical protein